MYNTIVWVSFFVTIIILILVDLFLLKKEKNSRKEIAYQTLFWVVLGLTFSIVIYVLFKYNVTENHNHLEPLDAMFKYLSGYLVELSLSVDNLFVILMIFTKYKIERENQHRALFLGILGAFILRGLMIGFGITLIRQIDWMTYILGVFLLYTALKMLFTNSEQHEEINENKFTKWLYKILPYDKNASKSVFFEKNNSTIIITPLFMALIFIEFTDVIFALDSIPAILAITTDSFIVFSSNMLAILGLRSLYFFLADLLEKFAFIKYSIIAILIFVAIKLLIIKYYHFSEIFTLSVITICLISGILFSIYKNRIVEYN